MALACVVALMLVVLSGCSGSAQESDETGSLEQRIATAVERQLSSDTAFDDVRAVVVQADGDTVFERYRHSARGDYHAVQSVTKSVVSTLVGIAVGEGQLRLDETLSELLPTYAEKMKPEVAEVTLQQVLTHTAGFVPDEAPDGQAFAAAADPVADILAAGSGKSGFAYSNAGAQLMSAILVEATGTSVLAYARSRLFDPLGIDTRPAAEPQLKASNIARYEAAGFAWPVDKAGLHQAWAYLKLRPGDLVKIGALYLNQGRWDGKQVVPASWVKEATTRHVDAPDGVTDGYGFQWWVGKVDETPTYLAWGYGGQLIQVVPEHRLVIAVATELRFDDPNSRGVAPDPLTYLVESAIIREFTDPRGPES